MPLFKPREVSSSDRNASSIVIEHTVPRGKGLAFRFWHANLTRTARKSDGYIRSDLCAPVKGRDLKWYSIVHFDSPENLQRWLKSEERELLIQAGQEVFESYQFKSFATGLEGWFSQKAGSEQMGLGPPAWKQNLAVVFGLYPVVMLQGMIFAGLGLMNHWSPASSMLVNNLITSSILTWFVMPWVSRMMSFWLQPAYLPIPKQKEVWGTIAIALSLILMAFLFTNLESQFF